MKTMLEMSFLDGSGWKSDKRCLSNMTCERISDGVRLRLNAEIPV